MIKDIQEKDIDTLNSLLRGELSAVETYEQCIEKMEEPVLVAQLQNLKNSHQHRVDRLTQKVRTLGGEPVDSSGAWGAFAKLVQGGAEVFGKSSAISVLEEGEDHGKKQYEELEELSPTAQQFVTRELMPEQLRSHDILSKLQAQV